MALWLWKTGQQFLRKLNIKLLYGPTIPFLATYTPKNGNHTFTQKVVHRCLCPPLHKRQKMETPKGLLNNEWINKMWYIHTTECYLVTKRNEVLIRDVVQHGSMNLGNMLSGRSQSRNHISYDSLYYEMSRIGKSIESKCIVARGCGRGNRGDSYRQWDFSSR